MTRPIVESVPLTVSITPIIREAQLGESSRVSGFVKPHAGHMATWVSFEAVLDRAERDGVVRLDARLRTGSLVSAVFDAFAESVAGRPDRLRWKAGCPGCGRAVRHLYVGSLAEPAWGCRRCIGLAYQSTRVHAPERALLMARKRRERLGQPGPIFEPLRRPHRMRFETFERHEQFVVEQLRLYLDAAPERAHRLVRLAARLGVVLSASTTRLADTHRSTPNRQRPTTAATQPPRTRARPPERTRG